MSWDGLVYLTCCKDIKVIWVLCCVKLLNHCDCNTTQPPSEKLMTGDWKLIFSSSMLFVVWHHLSLSFSLELIRPSSQSYSLSPLLVARLWPRMRSWSGCQGLMTVIFSCTSEPQGEPWETQEVRLGRAASSRKDLSPIVVSKIRSLKRSLCSERDTC